MKYDARHYISRNAVFLFIVACATALNAGALSSMPAPLRLLTALAASLFVPGVLLCEMVFAKGEFGAFEIVPIWMCVSTGMVLGPILVAGFALQCAFAGVSTAFCGACLLLIAANTAMALHAPSRLGHPRSESGAWAYVFIALLLLSSDWAFWLGGGMCGDAHNHLAFIRKIKEMPILHFGRDQYFKELTTSIHGVGLWNSSVALIAQLSGMDILDVWSRLPWIIVPVTILAFFAFARYLFQRDKPAYLSTILYIFWFGVFNIDPLSKQVNFLAIWTMFHWPSLVTRGIFVPIALLFILKYLQTGRWKDLALSAALSLVATMAYIPYFINLILYVAAFLLAALLLARRRREEIARLIAVLCTVGVVCGLYAVPMMRSLLPVRNLACEAHLRLEGFEGYTIFLADKYPLLNPARLIWPHPIIMLSFLLAPFLVLYRNDRAALFLFGATFLLLGIVLNPPLLMYLRREDQSLHRIWRLTEMFPFILILGFFLGKVIDAFREKWLAEAKPLRWLMATIFIVLLTLMCVQPIRYQMRLRADSNALTIVPSVERIWRKGVLSGTAGSVTLTDDVTGAVWPVYFPHFILSTYGVICSPIIDLRPRDEAIGKIYDHKTPMDARISLLRQYGVDYIVINRDRIKDFNKLGWDTEELKRAFMRRPDIFSLTYEDAGITVFKVVSRQG